MPKRRSRALLHLLRIFRGSGTLDISTNDKSPDLENPGNLLTGHQILVDREKASDADSFNMMVGLLHIKMKHPADSPVSLDIMVGLLIKMKHLADNSVPCKMSARLHRLKICLFLAACDLSSTHKGSITPPARGIFSLKKSQASSLIPHLAPETFPNLFLT